MKKITVRRVATPEVLQDHVKETILAMDSILFEGSNRPCLEQSSWWFAYYKGEPIGYAGLTYYPSLDSAFLSRVGVLSDFRGLGLQKRFIKARERQAKKDGYSRVVSYTSYDNVYSANNLIDCGYRLYIPKFDWGVKNSYYLLKYV